MLIALLASFKQQITYLDVSKIGELVRAKRLRRGWHTEPDPDDMLPVVNHLFMVVHGIGQSLDSTSIVTCAKG